MHTTAAYPNRSFAAGHCRVPVCVLSRRFVFAMMYSALLRCPGFTSHAQFESLDFFIENMGRFLAGQPLANVCDKRNGY